MVVALAIALLALAAPGLPLGLVLLALLEMLALGLVLLLPPLALPALVPAGTRAQRLEQAKRRETDEASGLVRGWRQQLPRLQGAAAAAEA